MKNIPASEQLANQRRNVAFDSYDITANQLVSMVENNEIHVAPEYQRHFVWDEVRQSHLIESILLGIPVPSLFMATNSDATWEVVDGLQRITTILNFVFPHDLPDKIELSKEPLKLRGLDKLSALNGISYADMDGSMQLSFKTRPIRVTVLNDRSDYQVRFDLFERLNTGGIILHEQEIRGCVYTGEFNDFIRDLASDPRLRKIVKRRDLKGRGNLEELVLKFFAYLEDMDSFRHSVKDFLNSYMETKTKKFDNKRYLKDLFDATLDYVIEHAPNGIVRSERPNTTPLLLFEGVSVGVASALQESRQLRKADLQEIMDSERMKNATTGGTNSLPKLRERIFAVKEFVS